jgi:DegV family protein with EDD domain
MAVKIVADSSCDLTEEMKREMNIDLAPLYLTLGDKTFVDDEKLDIKDYIKEMAECETSPKTACPSPEDYMSRFKGPDSIFVVTLSAALSGSYNSAVLAKNTYIEDVENKFIHVFNSLSASSAETLIALKINELSKENVKDTDIVDKVNDYIKNMKTVFLLESLEHLAKAGRLNPIVAKVASFLDIKPIMTRDEGGNIKLVEKIRGYKKAFRRLAETIGEQCKDTKDRVICIAHCNCPERAQEFKAEVIKKYNFKDVLVVEMGGLSSTYADDGGLVISF